MVTIAVIVVMAVLGCQKQHPIKVRIDPALQTRNPETIAVFPFLSTLHDAEDPDGIAPATMEQILAAQLESRRDYVFLPPSTVRYAVDLEEMSARYDSFLRDYARTGKADFSFLKPLSEVLKCDAFLIGVVDLWQKDEADAQENTTPATYVGATISILDKTEGKILFRAIDEDYMEGARTETSGRSLVTGASGAVHSDLGAKVHRAPPFEEVALKVIEALVSSIPVR
jgi:hypothetical protein